jgi:hypothetical protein
MKKSIFITLISCLLLASCVDSDYPFADGQWQLKTITEAGIETPVDTVFYNFMLKRNVFAYIVLTDDTPNGSYAFYGYIDTLSDKEIVLTLDEGSYTEFFFNYSDWREKQRRYEVLKLNSKEMILSFNNRTYSFKKH